MTTPVAISAISADPFGALLLNVNQGQSDFGDWKRRVQRTATLDGGAFVVDNGFSHADRTVRLDMSDQDAETNETAKRMVEVYDSVILMLPDGAYLATPESYQASGASASLSLLITGEAAL